MSAVVQLPRLAREAQIFAAALEILERRHARGAALTDPAATRAYLRLTSRRAPQRGIRRDLPRQPPPGDRL